MGDQVDASKPQLVHSNRVIRIADLTVVTAPVLFGLVLVGGALLVWSGVLPDYKGPSRQALGPDLGSAIVAGATMVLAGLTGLLALFTWESVFTGRQEVIVAEKAVKAAQDQAKFAEESLVVSWRPLLAEVPAGRPALESWRSIEIHPGYEKEFFFPIGFMNHGRGPAFVTNAFSYPRNAERASLADNPHDRSGGHRSRIDVRPLRSSE